MRGMTAALWLLLAGGGTIVAAAWAARLHPILDSLGVGLPAALAVLTLSAVAGVAARRRRLASLAAGMALAGAALLPLGGQDAPSEPIRLIQHNLLFNNDAGDLADRLEGADVATLQEVNAARPAVAALPAPWRAQVCAYTAVGDTAVATRWPILEAGCMDGGSWLRAETPAGAVTFVSLHLRWPWPKGQAAQVADLLPGLSALAAPVVVGGDFNQTPWSASVARVGAATGTAPLPGLRITLRQFDGWLRLPIDHVLVPEGWSGRAETTGFHGSDHRALAAEIGAEIAR
ncbi:endonuclease/exonuclease/phosphatase family protein [Jannaschia marina]|uniref:endonuclease/exonuclease/phosphatase family protein n=1 Tax=Jannaschia marina TaxID=2741674 RepID=UPI0015CE011B|nr:endonuclease/exonuclease/phosphatase family protein [Jannaschia marina]